MMNDGELLQNLVRVCFTKTEVSRRLRIIREYLENKFFKSKTKNLKSFFINSKYPSSDTLAIEKLSPDFFASFNKNNAYPQLTKIGKALNNLDTIHLYLPADFPPNDLSRVGLWFKKNVAEDVLLEIEIDSSLTLGCAVSKNGIYHDFSLKYFLKNKRLQILQVLGDYVKN